MLHVKMCDRKICVADIFFNMFNISDMNAKHKKCVRITTLEIVEVIHISIRRFDANIQHQSGVS